MKNLILFDQDTLHYRQSIYKQFRKVFAELGYNLIVVYDLKNNKIEEDTDFFIGENYSYKNCVAQLKKYKPEIIIQFIWLKYKFLFPFMFYCKFNGIKSILWSHGINMQNKQQKLKNQLYYLRQRLASAQIIYTPNEVQYTIEPRKKMFIANNALHYDDFPKIEKTKEELKKEMGFEGKKVILCVGRLSTHNRKVDLLFDGFKLIKDENVHLAVVGTGVTEEQQQNLNDHPRCKFFGPVFDPIEINKIYKMADLFVMPGGVGLAINHAFYHSLPILIENVNHSPEAYYLISGENGYIFNKADAQDLADKAMDILADPDKYKTFSENAKKTTTEGEASFEKMTAGFVNAIKYLSQKN